MTTLYKKLWHAWIDVLYPPHCIVCTQLIGKDVSYLCEKCWRDVDQHTLARTRCAENSRNEVVWSAFQGPLREAVHALKFCNKRGLGRVLGGRMAEVVGPDLAHVDAIIPLPLHPARVRERGYNQSFEVAFGLADALDLPLAQGWVVRVQNTRQQAHLNAQERRANMQSAFHWRGVPPGHSWALVDDVITTGATMSACIAAFPGDEENVVQVALARAEEDSS